MKNKLTRNGACCALALSLAAMAGCTGQVESSTPGGTGSAPGSGGRIGGGGGTGAGVNGGSGAINGGTGAVTGSQGGSSAVVGDPNVAGVRPLRLLTRREYMNTVRDLLNDTSVTPDSLPAEDEDPASPFAFHTPGTIAMLDATLYRDAAEALAKNAVTRMNTLLPCASSATTPAAELDCLTPFATKLYRRPLAPADTTRLTDLVAAGKGLGLNFSNAVGFVIEALLQSPEFLYHWEVDPGARTLEPAGGVVKLGSYELASRLSYFVWATMPDDALFTAAKAGQLGDAAAVETQVRRMLKDAKAAAAMSDFFVDWLDVDMVVDKPKDAKVYPMFNEALTTAMVSEVQSFVGSIVVNGNGRFDDLLTGTSSFANQALAALYGVSGVTGTAMKPVALNPAQRAGLLTMAGLMSVTGGAAGSDPPRRGKVILNKLLCGTLPPPPNNVPDPKPETPGVTTRQRFEEHSMDPCATACHTMIDPLGFAFENYDGIGQYRTMDSNQPVNASVTLMLDGQQKTVADARGLAAAMAASGEVQSCFAKQWFRYALGRLETAQDQASIAAAATTFKGANRDVRELLVGLVTSRTFRYRTPLTGEVLK